MTGRLRNFTGAQMTADHERRIRELERRLKASQTNLPRRTEPGGAPTQYIHVGLNANHIVEGAQEQIAFTYVVESVGSALSLSGGGISAPPGRYLVSLTVTFSSNGFAGWRRVLLDPWGSPVYADRREGLADVATEVSIGGPISHIAGGVIAVYAEHNTGSPVDIHAGGASGAETHLTVMGWD